MRCGVEGRSVGCGWTPGILFAVYVCETGVGEVETSVAVYALNVGGCSDVEGCGTDD